jgi:hypothetical protein
LAPGKLGQILYAPLLYSSHRSLVWTDFENMQAFLFSEEWQNVWPEISSMGQYPLIILSNYKYKLQRNP